MCDHLAAWKGQQGGTQPYLRAQRAFCSLWQAAKGAPVTGLACLSCGGCCHTLAELQTHAGATGHAVALDLGRSEIFCCCCGDYVYDAEFDEALTGAMAAAGRGTGGDSEASALPKQLEQECAESDLQRRSSEEEAGLPAGAAAAARRAGGSDGMPPGLRGLVNLGNTCFMSTVLQALLHTPGLARFYLGGGHPRAACRRRAAKPCLSCELEHVFSAAYSGQRLPFSPTRFLACWWQLSERLAGYRQQDAHEFYLFMLSGLEASRLGATPTPSAASPGPGKLEPEARGTPSEEAEQVLLVDAPHQGAGAVEFLHPGVKQEPAEAAAAAAAARPASPPPREPAASSEREGDDGGGVADRTFGGLLRSDVICAACGYVSTVHEPFVHLSLDVNPPGQPPPPLLRPPPPHAPAPSPSSRRGKKLVGAAAASSARAAAKAAALAAGREWNPAEWAAGGQPSPAVEAQAQEGFAGTTPASTEDTELGFACAELPAPSQERSGEGEAAEGGRSNMRDASALLTNSTDGNSSVGAGSAVATAQEAARDETLSSPPQHAAQRAWAPPPPLALPPGAAPPAPVSGGKRSKKGSHPSPKRPKVTRCNDCHTCRNKHLKKACLRNVELKRLAEEAECARLAAQLELHSPQRPAAAADAHAGGGHAPAGGGYAPAGGGYAQQGNGHAQQGGGYAPVGGGYAQQGNGHAQQGGGYVPVGGGYAHQGNGYPNGAGVRLPQAASSLPGQAGLAGMVPQQHLYPQHSELPQRLQQVQRPQQPQQLQPGWPAAAGVQPQPQPPQQQMQRPQQGQPQPPPLQQQVKASGGKGIGPPKPAGAVGAAAESGLDAGACLSLSACLRRYTRPERLVKWLCDRCSQRQAAKQVSIRRLPPALCLHLKRFQHPGSQGAGRKVATPVLYGERLDMGPFLSSAVLRARYGLRAEAGAGGGRGGGGGGGGSHYQLYAVVCHSGNLQGGHYIAYVRCDGRWFQCDDAAVVEVPSSVACGAQAYLLYYRLLGPEQPAPAPS